MPDGDDQLGSLLVCKQERKVFTDPCHSHHLVGDAKGTRALLTRSQSVAVAVHEQLGAGAKRVIRDGVHVAHDHVGRVARLEESIGAAVDGDQDRLEVAHVRPDHPQVALVAGTARDDECVAVAKARRELRELDALGEQLSLFAQVAHRVLGESLERLRDTAALLGERVLELVLLEHASGGQARAVPVQAGAANCQQLALVNLVEQICAGYLDQTHAAAHKC